VIAPEALEFPPLNCSLGSELGDYYQDLSQAILLVESGYHGGFDERGLPMVEYHGQTAYHNPITIAQYALANMTAFRRGEFERNARARAQLDWLVDTQERAGEWAGCWLLTADNRKYKWLHAPWTSALASGNAISALLRGRELFQQETYGTAADAAYLALHRQRTSERLSRESSDELWYEEYPADESLRVLNGHIYTLFGVADYARVTGDPEAASRWRRAAHTALTHLEQFDLGYWSAYDLRWYEPTSIHYHKNIHVPQLRILSALTGDDRFAAVADRWESYLSSFVCRARRSVALRLRRLRKP
jgi:hypothetical protein